MQLLLSYSEAKPIPRGGPSCAYAIEPLVMIMLSIGILELELMLQHG